MVCLLALRDVITVLLSGLGIVAAVLMTLSTSCGDPAPLADRLHAAFEPEAGDLVASGWTEAELGGHDGALPSLLRVHLELPGRSAASLPSVAGTYHITGDRLHFRPLLGWSPGQTYTARLYAGSGSNGAGQHAPIYTTRFTIPSRSFPAARPTVAWVHPLSDEVPENLLRFYVRFSEPMQRGTVLEHVHLLDGNGTRLESPFLRIGQEFWSPDMRILTLILDPGRIKLGVAPNLQRGSPLRDGNRYTLVIGGELTSARDMPMGTPFQKRFLVVAADRVGPVPSRWKLEPPASASRGALRTRFEAPIDPLVGARLIRVETATGQPMPGQMLFSPTADWLDFVPNQPWQPGQYRLAIHPALEDIAGNRVSESFEMEAGTVSMRPGAAVETVTVDFSLDPLAPR